MIKATLTFNDGSKFKTKLPEEDLINQMKRPQNKRLYIFGVEFSEVIKAEVEI